MIFLVNLLLIWCLSNLILKAACGLTNNPLDSVANIDGADANNELAVVEYIDDMYKFYKLAEVCNFFLSLSPFFLCF